MILLTDRMSEGRELRQKLGLAENCAVVALHQATARAPARILIICDVAFDNVASIQLLHAALLHHRGAGKIPLLCLTRDPSHLAVSQARQAGATAVLPYSTPHAEVLEVVRTLVEGTVGRGGRVESSAGVGHSVREANSALADLLKSAKGRQRISVASLEKGSKVMLAAIRHDKIRGWLDVVWSYDDITYQHCLLVAGLATAFAIELGLTANQQRLVSQAALIHDIGKAHIPSEILNKPGHLSPSEMAIMRTHPNIGYQLLARQNDLHPQLLEVVRYHHEFLDGSGYPSRLHGAQISRLVRLVTICDIYAALIERRPYKEPASPEKAYSILDAMESKLDRGLLACFKTVVLHG